MKIHYAPKGENGDGLTAACNLSGVPAERLTADLDAADCGNCLSSLPWRNDISQRDYREQYEKFHGPGGFLDRAGQSTPASATTAPQALAALERVLCEELERAAMLGRHGAGTDVIARAARESARTVMAGAEQVIRIALEEAAAKSPAAFNGPVPF